MEFTPNSDASLAQNLYKPLLEQAQTERDNQGMKSPHGYRVQIRHLFDPHICYSSSVITSASPLICVTHVGNPSHETVLNNMRTCLDEIVSRTSSIYKEYQEAKQEFLTRRSGIKPTPESAVRYLCSVLENLPLLSARKELFSVVPYDNWIISGEPTQENAPIALADILGINVMDKDLLTLKDSLQPAFLVLRAQGNRFVSKDPLLDLLEEKNGRFTQRVLFKATENEVNDALESSIYAGALAVAQLAQASPQVLEEAFNICTSLKEIESYVAQFSPEQVQ
jgi:hypothetical protein